MLIERPKRSSNGLTVDLGEARRFVDTSKRLAPADMVGIDGGKGKLIQIKLD
jgi:hypothetical protein